MNMTRILLTSSVCAVLCCCNALVGQAADRPVINTNLRWSKPATKERGHPSFLKFITSAKLATEGLPEESSEGATLKRGSVDLLDVQTGAVTQRVAWSAPSSASNFALRAVVPLSDGRFVFQSWDQLTLFSEDGKVLKTRTLPLEGRQADYNPKITLWDIWQFASSPDGRDLLAIRHRASIPVEVEEHWLSVETLEDIQLRSDTALCGVRAIGRAQVICRTGIPKKEPLAIRSRSGEPHVLCQKCFGAEAVFLDDSEIIVSAWPRARFLVVTAGGQIQDDQTLGGKEDRIFQMCVAPLSHQVAFLLGPRYVGNKAGKFSVFVYDAVRQKVTLLMQIPQHIYVERVESGTIETWGSLQIALSPDGLNLAVLDDSSLQMYGLTRDPR